MISAGLRWNGVARAIKEVRTEMKSATYTRFQVDDKLLIYREGSKK